MTEEELEMLNAYKAEVEAVYQIANKLDAFNPELKQVFTGKPSERIFRQLCAHKVPGFLDWSVK